MPLFSGTMPGGDPQHHVRTVLGEPGSHVRCRKENTVLCKSCVFFSMPLWVCRGHEHFPAQFAYGILILLGKAWRFDL